MVIDTLTSYRVGMVKFLVISLLIFPVFGQAEEIKWVEESTVNADINCDGIDDKSKIGYKGFEVVLQIDIGKSEEKHLMEFGLRGSKKTSQPCVDQKHSYQGKIPLKTIMQILFMV